MPSYGTKQKRTQTRRPQRSERRACAYADIIVVIPCVAVILIQCKFYDDSMSLTPEVIEEEAEKLREELKYLNLVAEVPDGAFFRVLHNVKKE